MMIEKVKVCPHVVSRAIGDQVLLLIPNQDQIQQLNEVGSFIWTLILERESDLGELTDAVSARFAVAGAEARQDIHDFLEHLKAQELLEVRLEESEGEH